MRTYAKVNPQFWQGRTAKRLRRHPDAQRLALYLRTCPSANMLGLYPLSSDAMALDLGVSASAIDGALALLSELDLAHYDDDAEVVWIPGEAFVQVASKLSERDKQAIGLSSVFAAIPECRFIEQAYGDYHDALHLKPHPSMAQKRTFGGPSKALRSQEQEQEQEQEQTKPTTPHSNELGTTTRARDVPVVVGIGVGKDMGRATPTPTAIATVIPIGMARRGSAPIPSTATVASALDATEPTLCSSPAPTEVDPQAQAPTTQPASTESAPRAASIDDAWAAAKTQAPQTPAHNVCSVGEGGAQLAQLANSHLPHLDSRSPGERLTVAEVQSYVVQRGAAYPTVGLGYAMRREVAAQAPTVATLREALSAAPRTQGGSVDRHMASVLRRHRVEGIVPEPQASEISSTVPASESKIRPHSPDVERDRNREAWADAFEAAGYPRDDELITERADEGGLEPEDVELIVRGGGDWSAYDAARAAVREEGQRQYAEAVAKVMARSMVG